MNVECSYVWNLAGETCADILSVNVNHTEVSIFYYFGIFLLTCFLESPFYFIFAKIQKLKTRQILKQILILNLATHPIVFFLLPWIFERTGNTLFTYIWIAEFFAFATETFLLKRFFRYSWPMALGASGLANFFSWSAGIWLQTQNLL